MSKIPEVNIGLVGHVDHGKTTLTQALSGEWTDQHSEELERGITIRIGYADITYYNSDGEFNVEGDGEEARTVSLVDAPGHETLMANVLSGAAIMDGAILLIAADEEVPQPQTREHLAALDIVGIDNIVIAQNKIDLVSKEEAKQNYEDIKEFVEGTVAEDAPIVPVSAQHEVNIDALLESIDAEIPTPERDLDSSPRLLAARSFDINKPGTSPEELRGGVIGGSLVRGQLEKGDEIELKPGVRKDGEDFEKVTTQVQSIIQGDSEVEKGKPGGLIAVETELDPAMAKSDGLAGNVLGIEGELPEVTDTVEIEADLMESLVGSEGEQIDNIKEHEALMLNIGTTKTAGIVTQAGKHVRLDLKMPVCVEKDDRVAISRQVGSRWRLIGHGTINSTE